MSPSDLDAELRRRAEQAAKSILEGARTEATRLESETHQAMEDRHREVMRDTEADCRAEARKVIASERHAMVRSVLVAKTKVVERVLERARALLPTAIQSESYLASLEDELRRALQFVDGEGAVVRCSSNLQAAVREALRTSPEVTVESGVDVGSGFVVVGGKGSVLVDGCLETRLDRLASALAIEIHERLRDL